MASGIVAAALIRRVAQAGGNGAILARGDDTAGAILIVCRERGVLTAMLERVMGGAASTGDGYAWTRVGPSLDEDAADSFENSAESRASEWIERRRSRDPDLWVIELDIPQAERFAAEIATTS